MRFFWGNPNVAPPGSERDRDIAWIAFYTAHRLYAPQDTLSKVRTAENQANIRKHGGRRLIQPAFQVDCHQHQLGVGWFEIVSKVGPAPKCP
jgi:hypothetical protein